MKYDERQLRVRGKGFMIGFWLMITLTMVAIMSDIFYGKPIFLNQRSMGTALIFISMIFIVAYFILNDAYFPFREDKNLPWITFIWLTSGLCSIDGLLDFRSYIINGQISFTTYQFFFPLLGFTIGSCGTYKLVKNKEEEPWKMYLTKRNGLIGVVFLAVVIISLVVNIPLGEKPGNLFFNFSLPIWILILGLWMLKKNRNQLRWKVMTGSLLLIGIIWLGYICLYYLTGFHNHFWHN